VRAFRIDAARVAASHLDMPAIVQQRRRTLLAVITSDVDGLVPNVLRSPETRPLSDPIDIPVLWTFLYSDVVVYRDRTRFLVCCSLHIYCTPSNALVRDSCCSVTLSPVGSSGNLAQAVVHVLSGS
jgi:hypothetical protein